MKKDCLRRASHDFTLNLKIWFIYLALFYVNYSLLMPYFLFVKKYILYIILLLVLISGLFSIKYNIDEKLFFDPVRNERIHFMPRQLSDESRPPMNMTPVKPQFFRKMPFGRSFIPGLSQLLMIVLASISLRLIQKWQDDEKMRSEIEKEKISTELSYLKQQINPHFLFNAINSIYSLSLLKKPSTSDAILKLSSIIRYMLYETDKKFVTLNDEIQAIKDYIELQKLRLNEKVKLTFRVKGDTEPYSIVPLLLIPLIENAFKHGVDNINNSFIDINIEVENDSLNLKIRNTIVPKSGKNANESGIGIKNIVRRLELLYPQAYLFNAAPEDDCFLVLLKLRLKQ